MYFTCDQRVTESGGLHRLGLDKDGATGGSLAADQHHGGGPGGYRAGHQGRWCRHHGLAHPGDGHLAGQADDGNRIITRPDMKSLPQPGHGPLLVASLQLSREQGLNLQGPIAIFDILTH